MMKMATDNKLFSNLQRAAYTQLASVSQRWMMIVTKRPWFAKQLRSVMLSRGVSTIAALNMYIIQIDIMHVVGLTFEKCFYQISKQMERMGCAEEI